MVFFGVFVLVLLTFRLSLDGVTPSRSRDHPHVRSSQMCIIPFEHLAGLSHSTCLWLDWSSPQTCSSVHGTTVHHPQASSISPSPSFIPNIQSILFFTSQMSLRFLYFYPFGSWDLLPGLSNSLFPVTTASKETIILTLIHPFHCSLMPKSK